MNAEQIKQELNHEDCYGPKELEGFTIIESEEEVDMKWVFTTSIIRNDTTGEHFEVVESRSNSGYWSDSESGETEVYSVEPQEVVVKKTIWNRV